MRVHALMTPTRLSLSPHSQMDSEDVDDVADAIAQPKRRRRWVAECAIVGTACWNSRPLPVRVRRPLPATRDVILGRARFCLHSSVLDKAKHNESEKRRARKISETIDSLKEVLEVVRVGAPPPLHGVPTPGLVNAPRVVGKPSRDSVSGACLPCSKLYSV